MTRESGTGPAAFALPLFFECDREGRVVWMTDAALDRLGPAVNNARALATHPEIASILIRFTRVMEWQDRILIRAVVGEEGGAPEHPSTAVLMRLEYNLLQRIERLQRAQTRLAVRVRRGGRASGTRLLEQLELERQRLGRDLHTGVGQSLAAIKVNLELIDAGFPEPPQSVRSALDNISSLADDALQQVRFVSHRLHPPDWQRLSLGTALTRLWEVSGIPRRFEAVLDLEVLDTEPPHPVRILLYRAAQEALSNLARHSQATRVAFSLRRGQDSLILTVQDNGSGFDAAALFTGPPRAGAGIGLRSLREQVESLGGSFEIRSSSEGTTLVVDVPAVLDDQT